MDIITIKRKKYTVFVKPTMVKDLDRRKCSNKFLSHDFPNDYIVYVKCDMNGIIDYRGKKQEYRIVKPD